MAKINLVKERKDLYNPSGKKPAIIDVPAMNFLMIDGSGNPNNSPEYSDAVSSLYGLAYALKFKIKKSDGGVDYAVLPLEGLWWADDMTQFNMEDRHLWRWTMMIRQPEFVTQEILDATIPEVRKKKNPPKLDQIRFESYHEGLSTQIMHTGPYADEPPVIAALHEFIAESGYDLRGKHHEIYLKDPTRTKPENLKTVLRQPIQAST